MYTRLNFHRRKFSWFGFWVILKSIQNKKHEFKKYWRSNVRLGNEKRSTLEVKITYFWSKNCMEVIRICNDFTLLPFLSSVIQSRVRNLLF